MKCKWFIFYVILCFCSINICAQSKYEIYKIKGTVKVVSQAKKAKKGTQLTENDEIKIENKASISILDKINCKLYEYSKVGIYRVSQIIQSCADENKSITSRFLREIKDRISSGDGKNTYSVGAVRRGDIDELVLEQIYAFISEHINDTSSENSQVEIKLEKYEKGTISLILVNNSEKPLYANVLQIIKDQLPFFCFEGGDDMACLLLEPHSELNLNHVKIADMGQKFLLICSDAEFDSDDIQNMINKQFEPNYSLKNACQCYSFVLQTTCNITD